MRDHAYSSAKFLLAVLTVSFFVFNVAFRRCKTLISMSIVYTSKMKKQNKTHPAIKNETEPDFAKSLFTPEWTLNIAVDRLP